LHQSVALRCLKCGDESDELELHPVDLQAKTLGNLCAEFDFEAGRTLLRIVKGAGRLIEGSAVGNRAFLRERSRRRKLRSLRDGSGRGELEASEQ